MSRRLGGVFGSRGVTDTTHAIGVPLDSGWRNEAETWILSLLPERALDDAASQVSKIAMDVTKMPRSADQPDRARHNRCD